MLITSYYCTSTLQFDSQHLWDIMESCKFNNVKVMWGWTLTYLPDTHNIQRMLDCQYFISSRLWHQCNLHFCVQSTQFKPVKGLDPLIVKTLQILMVSSFLQAIGYSWLLENWLDYSSFFSLLTSESLLLILTTKTISKSWVTQSRSVHQGFLGIYPSSHVLKDWINP